METGASILLADFLFALGFSILVLGTQSEMHQKLRLMSKCLNTTILQNDGSQARHILGGVQQRSSETKSLSEKGFEQGDRSCMIQRLPARYDHV